MAPSLALETFVQILEVRAGENDQEVMITVAMSGDAIGAILVALSEQRDRKAQDPAEKAEDVLALREQTDLVDRFDSLAAGEGHAVVRLSRTELRSCVFELTRYVGRVDGEHFQPAELRTRLQIIGCVSPALWEANAAAATTDHTDRAVIGAIAACAANPGCSRGLSYESVRQQLDLPRRCRAA